jgi:hypothetical protein
MRLAHATIDVRLDSMLDIAQSFPLLVGDVRVEFPYIIILFHQAAENVKSARSQGFVVVAMRIILDDKSQKATLLQPLQNTFQPPCFTFNTSTSSALFNHKSLFKVLVLSMGDGLGDSFQRTTVKSAIAQFQTLQICLSTNRRPRFVSQYGMMILAKEATWSAVAMVSDTNPSSNVSNDEKSWELAIAVAKDLVNKSRGDAAKLVET